MARLGGGTSYVSKYFRNFWGKLEQFQSCLFQVYPSASSVIWGSWSWRLQKLFSNSATSVYAFKPPAAFQALLGMLWGQDSRTAWCFGPAIASLCGNHYIACFEPWFVPLSKVIYHTCFICEQRCKCWSHRLKLTSLVISDVKPIIYIYFLFYFRFTLNVVSLCRSVFLQLIHDLRPIQLNTLAPGNGIPTYSIAASYLKVLSLDIEDQLYRPSERVHSLHVQWWGKKSSISTIATLFKYTSKLF